ncbi:4-hydroxybenzoate polyprenyltransferase [Herbihabitans rhizosphaerae]|uniref:4-hydroxybenzoate polyprenyltransferase n=1 Tax=Herbihabitans rhizosphaerae TaxID=1872711 RepID=A0A4V2EU19_9PSEU|nr:UbiA family prenyltransferase [Herbihabitans rhizosphaerae]RZS43033.1 4-hydroxybenzoate polyprenyltransferase [Herbihabitans rhizosphaerae]
MAESAVPNSGKSDGRPTAFTSKPSATMPKWRHPVRRIGFEFYLSWRFLQSNYPPAVLFSLILTLGAWHISDASFERLLLALVTSLSYSWLFLYVHELPNQIVGAAEDAVNKPNRPIPSGLCTPQQAQRRWYPVVGMYLAVATFLGVLPWAICWIAVVYLYHYTGWHRHWVIKALEPPAGAAVLTAGSWSAATGQITSIAWTWILAYFLFWSGACVLQDQRDVAGDELAGRRTLPMVIGDRASRIAGAAFLGVLPATLVAPMTIWAPKTLAVFILDVTYTTICWLLAWRLLKRRDRISDDLTYRVYAALSCALAASPLLL